MIRTDDGQDAIISFTTEGVHVMNARELLIIRHAKSSWAAPEHSDFERRLDQRGVDDGSKMAKAYSAALPRPDRVLCSPARRTRDTLAFLIPDLLDPRRVEYEDSLYLGSASTWLSWIRATPAPVRVLALMGHNPGLTDLVNLLLASEAPSLDNLPTLGCAHLRSEADWSNWGEAPAEPTEKVAILRPKQLRDDSGT